MNERGILGIITIIISIVIISGCTGGTGNNTTQNNTNLANNSTSVGAVSISSATINSNGYLVVKFSSDALKGYNLEDSSQIGIQYYLTDKNGYRDDSIGYPTGTFDKAKLETPLDTDYEQKGYKSVEIDIYDVANNTIIAKGQATLQ